MKDFDLSYDGSFAEHRPIHQTLVDLSTGSAILLKKPNGNVVAPKGDVTVAVLSKKA